MAFWDKLKGELIDIIEWLDSTNDTMVYRFDRYNNEIKNGAKLIVRESQVAVFVNEGQFADTYQAGTHTLSTENMPILTTLKGWKYGFNSPFKAEVYFVSMRNFTDRKWGTKNPIMMRDADFGVVRVRAFGSYAIKIVDPTLFIKEIVGTDGNFTTDEVTDQLRNFVVSKFTDALGKSQIPVLDLAARYTELSYKIKDQIVLDFNAYGLELTSLLIENISLPPEVEQMMDKRTSMGILGNMDQYTKFQTANALEEMAKNPSGGGLSDGLGIGVGIGIANQFVNNQQNNQQQNVQQQNNIPPPPPAPVAFFVAVNGQQTGPFDLNTLSQMLKQGQFQRNTYVWKAGMANWAEAAQVPELASVFANVPPPPPM